MASENGVEAEDTQESDNDAENDSQEIESSNPETSTTFHSQRPCEHCENMKEGFLRCHDCGAVTHKNAKTLETNFYSPSKEENQDED